MREMIAVLKGPPGESVKGVPGEIVTTEVQEAAVRAIREAALNLGFGHFSVSNGRGYDQRRGAVTFNTRSSIYFVGLYLYNQGCLKNLTVIFKVILFN